MLPMEFAATVMVDDASLTTEQLSKLIDRQVAKQLQSTSYQPEPSTDRDGAMTAQGQAAFWDCCTACHDAGRSLERSKTYGEWLATIRRMAVKDGAAVSPADFDPIAEYLASRSISAGQETPRGESTFGDVSLNATISTVWRGGNDDVAIEKPGFFADVWVGAQWQPRGPFRATVTACTSCHSDRNSSAGFTIELVEASASVNLSDLITGDSAADSGCERLLNVEAKAGRFVVPFGGFAAMSHPGVYRTITTPLMFNMGRRVGFVGPLQPVLPGPYADEGVNLHSRLALVGDTAMTLDVFAVNGLQQGGPGIFNASRRYDDNNREPAVGGRMTVGNSSYRLGASLMTGTLQDDGAPQLDYQLASADATWRYEDRLRAYFEYAIRSDDSVFVAGGRNHTYGIVIETEYYLPHDSPLSLLARYDTLEHRDASFGNTSTDRFTWGLNYRLPGGSLLMVNHEHWMLDSQPDDMDVIGIRWTATH
ncbi:MAG: hypothetical protein O3C40_19320 [Planctomycetota bacterium]|nr:hypothetical protein [Planctomycetota bacterium]